MPAAIAAVLVTTVLGLLSTTLGSLSKSVAARIPPPDYMVGLTPEGDIWLRGRVGPGMLNQFSRIRPKQGRRVILTSAGGAAAEGVAIAEIIYENRMHTVVRGACYSACANYLFFAGATKTVEPGGMIGFHGWPRLITQADRTRLAEAIRRRRPETSEVEIEVALQQAASKSASDLARQMEFYAAIGAPGLPRLMRILNADPVDYPTGRPYRGGRLAIVPTKQTLERCFGVQGIAAYDRPERVEPIDWASPLAPKSGDELQLVWTRQLDPDCAVFERDGPQARPAQERRREPDQRRRRLRITPL